MIKRDNKALVHGSLSIVITAVVIAVVIILNVGIYALSKSYLWYFDMTEDQVYTLSEETKEILSPVKDDVSIIFTKEEDELIDGKGTNEYMKYIYKTAKELEGEFPNITVKCVDIVKNPGFFDYYYNTAATNILTTSVIVDSNGEFRLLSSDAFFVWDENRTYIWGYNGESKFAASILQVTASDMPTVCFTEGHGEPSPDECRALKELCESAGYNVRTIDLAKEEIDDDVRIIIINDPLYDFSGVEASELGNEIDRLASFLDDYGCVMVFIDPEKAENLTNLTEMLKEWGVETQAGKTVVDKSNSLTVDGREIIAEYEIGDTLGASLYTSISSLSSMPKTIVADVMPLKLLYETDSSSVGTYQASAVLYSHETAEVRENGNTSPLGRAPIMTITRRENIKDNDYIYSYLTVCGTPSFVSDKYLNSNSYANSDILLNTVRLTGREKIVADIDLKMFDDTTLEATVTQSNVWTAVFAVAVPVLVGVAGIIVCYRRRHL